MPRYNRSTRLHDPCTNWTKFATQALVRVVRPMEVDPRWLDVVAGRRYTQATAIERYPQLTKHLFADLAFEKIDSFARHLLARSS